MSSSYLVTSPKGKLTLYYEPHCVYNESLVEKERADIVITPVIKQLLPYFLLVSGQEDAVRLAKLLQAKYIYYASVWSCSFADKHLSQCDYSSLLLFLLCRFIVPMKNGDLDSKGALASLVKAEGTMESFKVTSFLILN